MEKIHPTKYYDENLKFINTIKIDGYSFGDRLLEGVYFVLKWDGTKYKFDRYLDKSTTEYMSRLNEKLWIEAAEDCVETGDVAYSLENEELSRGEFIIAAGEANDY